MSRKPADQTQPDRPSKQREQLRTESTPLSTHPGQQELEEIGLDDLTGCSDYVIPLTADRQHRRLRDNVVNRHLETFFRTIHIFIPIFDVTFFTTRYNAIRPILGDNRLFTTFSLAPGRLQFLCLLLAVLSLGALYEDEQEDSSSWAAWYLAEAQSILGRLLDAVNLELVQAAMLTGANAQHAMKPNLAYNINGIAIRLAYSIGLNVESTLVARRIHLEEGRRTWWMVYIQEVELSLDSG